MKQRTRKPARAKTPRRQSPKAKAETRPVDIPFSPPLPTTDRPYGAAPGPVGFFVVAQLLDEKGNPIQRRFALAKCATREQAVKVADHAEGLAGEPFERVEAAFLLAHHRVGVFDASAMTEDERLSLERSIYSSLTSPITRRTHAGDGRLMQADERSGRATMTHRLTQLARDLADGDSHTRPSLDEDADYRPASAFPKGMRSLLAMASAPGRKSKRVRTIHHGGTKLYARADAVRWWPEKFEKQT